MSEVIIDKCTCGEVVHVEIGRVGLCRRDGKRPFYPDEKLPDGLNPNMYNIKNSTAFRCRRCKEWLADTVKAAKFE